MSTSYGPAGSPDQRDPASGSPVVVLGVTGGIAAYKAVEICRRLVDEGVHVIPVLTEDATRFVGAVTFSALASEPVRRTLWEEAHPIPHTDLGRRADAVLVVPATATFLARYCAGVADDLLAATVLATRAPVVVCPAMHSEMWEHPATQANLATLRARGAVVVPPAEGHLAGGDVGVGRLAEPDEVLAALRCVLAARPAGADLAGRRVVVSAGGTREPIDPVRCITNRSSGRQGHALAAAAASRGGEVVLVTASDLPVPPGVRPVPVQSAEEMERALLAECQSADVVVMAAAVADFRPKVAAAHKLARSDGPTEILLEPTPDILAELGRRRRPGQVLVGFAAETGPDLERARAKLRAKGVDLLVVNDVSAPGAGFDTETNAVTVLGADGSSRVVPLQSKAAVAHDLFDMVVAHLQAGAADAARATPEHHRASASSQVRTGHSVPADQQLAQPKD